MDLTFNEFVYREFAKIKDPLYEIDLNSEEKEIIREYLTDYLLGYPCPYDDEFVDIEFKYLQYKAINRD